MCPSYPSQTGVFKCLLIWFICFSARCLNLWDRCKARSKSKLRKTMHMQGKIFAAFSCCPWWTPKYTSFSTCDEMNICLVSIVKVSRTILGQLYPVFKVVWLYFHFMSFVQNLQFHFRFILGRFLRQFKDLIQSIFGQTQGQFLVQYLIHWSFFIEF